MIQPDLIKMHFSESNKCKCKVSGFKIVTRAEVIITADLENDSFIYDGKCPGCGVRCINIRRI